MNLSDLRKSRALSQKEAAYKLNVTRAYLCRVERGSLPVSVPLHSRLRRLYRCKAAVLHRAAAESRNRWLATLVPATVSGVARSA